MADNEEGIPEWEVVSLTASAYAATADKPDHEVASSSDALLMSRHFAFPPTHHLEAVENRGDQDLNTEELISQGKMSNTKLQADVPVCNDDQSESTLEEDTTRNCEGYNQEDLHSSVPNVPLLVGKDKYDDSKLPCEAWWKKHAISIYTRAKEANAFWSIFVAATVMGLVILGQRVAARKVAGFATQIAVKHQQ